MRVQASHPGQRCDGVSLEAPQGGAESGITNCSVEPVWPAPSPERDQQRPCLPVATSLRSPASCRVPGPLCDARS